MAAAKPKKTYKPVKSFAVKKKAKQAKQALLAVLIGSVLLGGLALAFANTRKSQDVRSDASGGTRVCAFSFYDGPCSGNPAKTTGKLISNTSAYPSNSTQNTNCNAQPPTNLPDYIIVPSGWKSYSVSCWIEPNFVPQPTSTGSTPVSGSDDEKIIIGGTIYACDGSRLANVPVKAFGNTVTTNAQGKWEVRKNTSVIANGIQEFTVVAGKDVTSTHATTYTPRSAAPQFAKVNAGCGKIACDYKPSATSNSRGYSVNKYQFGTDMATYRKWFVTSTTAPNPLLGFDFKPVDCDTTLNITASQVASNVQVSAAIAPKPNHVVSKVQFAARKKTASGSWGPWIKPLKEVTRAPYNAIYSARDLDDQGFSGVFQFTANVYYTNNSKPCTGDASYSGPWFSHCTGRGTTAVNFTMPGM